MTRPEAAPKRVVPPAIATFFSLPPSKNAMNRLSCDQNGNAAPSVPCIGRASALATGRCQSWNADWARATNTRDRPACNPLRQIIALDQFHDQRANTGGLFQAVNVRDIRMVQDASVCASRVNRASRSASLPNRSGRTLSATSRFSLVSRAR